MNLLDRAIIQRAKTVNWGGHYGGIGIQGSLNFAHYLVGQRGERAGEMRKVISTSEGNVYDVVVGFCVCSEGGGREGVKCRLRSHLQ